MKLKSKRFISLLLSTIMMTSSVSFKVYAGEESDSLTYDETLSGSSIVTSDDEKTDAEDGEGTPVVTEYPYTFFASANANDAISITAQNFCINGNIATNGTVALNGNYNLNGTVNENTELSMIDLSDKIAADYLQDVEVLDNYSNSDFNININTPISVIADFSITGNTNINSVVKSTGNISINGEVLNMNSGILYSETGDISISATNTTINGLVYAPNGIVKITANNANLNNVIVLANKIIINADVVNANHNQMMAEFVNTELGKEIIISDKEKEEQEEYGINTIILYAMGDYNREKNSIDVCWASNYPNGTYKIFTSDDNINYEYVGNAEEKYHYSYNIEEDFEIKYFKVVLTMETGEVSEAIPFTVHKSGEGYYTDLLDTDEDSIPDILEYILDTDIEGEDSDEDGLSDYIELMITDTDPNVYDSVTTGVPDLEADNDEDGLSNREELALGTYPNIPDSDDDELPDGDEVNIYGTNPLLPDSDFDDLSDYDEQILGFDPLNPDTNGNEIKDGHEKVTQTVSKDIECDELPAVTGVSVTLSVNGNAQKVVDIKNMYKVNTLSSDLVGIKGAPIEFTSANEFDNAEISFIYDEDKLDIPPENLGILYYNEKEQFYEIMETTLDKENHTVTMETPHFSEYTLVDLEKWLKAWEENIAYDSENIAKKNQYWQGDVVTPQELCDRYNTYYGYNDVIDLSDVLPLSKKGNLYVRMGTVTMPIKDSGELISYNCLFIAQEEFNYLAYPNAAKSDVMYVFPNVGGWTISYTDYDESGYQFVRTTDSPYNHWPQYEDVDPSDITYTYTGRFFVPAYDIFSIDNDEDGLPDVYEYVGMKLANGKVITTSTESTIDMFKGHSIGYDSDNDGLSDGQEVSIIEEFNGEHGYFKITSDPNLEDSDGDGLLDGKRQIGLAKKIIAPIDPNPMVTDGNGIWKYHINTLKTHKAPETLGDWYDYNLNINSIDDVVDLGDRLVAAATDDKALENIKKSLKTNLNDFKNNNIHARLAVSLSNFLMFRLDEDGTVLHSQTAEDIAQAKGTGVGEMDWPHQAVNIALEKLTSTLLQENITFNNTETWQKADGYCKLYDLVFRIGTFNNIDREKFYFYDKENALDSNKNLIKGNREYVLWIWRGCYLNLGSGCEMGIYYRVGDEKSNATLEMITDKKDEIIGKIESLKNEYIDENEYLNYLNLISYLGLTVPDIEIPNINIKLLDGMNFNVNTALKDIIDESHIDSTLWKVSDSNFPMQLYLYNKNDGVFDTVVQWEPNNRQWWITGFNPEKYPPVVENMVMIGSISFDNNSAMYNSFKDNLDYDSYPMIITDDLDEKIWVIWNA